MALLHRRKAASSPKRTISKLAFRDTGTPKTLQKSLVPRMGCRWHAVDNAPYRQARIALHQGFDRLVCLFVGEIRGWDELSGLLGPRLGLLGLHLGLLLGPLMMTVFLTLVEIYRDAYRTSTSS